MGIKHLFTSAIADGANAALVRPSNWNANHTIDGDVDFGGNDILNVGNSEYLNVKDFGATGDGSTNDRAAVQACLDEAFGSYASPHGNANRFLNKAVFFPPGNYNVGTGLVGRSWESPHLFGTGRGSVNLTGDTTLYLNGCRYGRFENINFSKNGSTASEAAVDLSWDNTGDVPLTGNVFYMCGFGGNGLGVGCAIGRGTFMGSENLFLHCTFGNLTYGIQTYNQNAIDNSVIGGDAFNCTGAAFYAFNGQIAMVIGGSYANNTGFDYKFGGVPSDLVMMGIRSESYNFLDTSSSNGGITLIGVEHVGAGGEFIGDAFPGPITCIGCNTEHGTVGECDITWLNSGDVTTLPTFTGNGLVDVNFNGKKYVIRADNANGVTRFNNAVVHNIGLGGSCSVSPPQRKGWSQTYVVHDAFNMQIVCAAPSGFLGPNGFLSGGASDRVDCISNTPASTLTITCVQSGASIDVMFAVTAMTGTWSIANF